MKERTTPDSRNTPSNTNVEEEDIVDALGNDGKASMPEHVKRPNPWRKMMMMMMTMMMVGMWRMAWGIFNESQLCHILPSAATLISCASTFGLPYI